MPLLIDQGEEKLIKRDLIDANAADIAWSDITDIEFQLVRKGLVRYTFSKSAGSVTEATTGVEFELSPTVTEDYVAGTYDLRAKITVDDSRFPTAETQDIQTQKNWAIVLGEGDEATGDTDSVETNTIQFKVIP